jgi:hypothetical protein
MENQESSLTDAQLRSQNAAHFEQAPNHKPHTTAANAHVSLVAGLRLMTKGQKGWQKWAQSLEETTTYAF